MNTKSTADPAGLEQHLVNLKLPYLREHYASLAQQAITHHWTPIDYLARLIEGEAHLKQDRSIQRRIKLARFPMIKTLDQFQWNWPKKINRLQVQALFRWQFIQDRANVIFLGGVGLGKTHLSIALGHAACLQGYSVLFTSAVEVINTLSAARAAGKLKYELNKYVKPQVLILDELGYLPIDQHGANLLFQIIGRRYESGSLIITSNRPYKNWLEIFANDASLTSATLDRLLHHAQTILIEGKSFRMKDQIDP